MNVSRFHSRRRRLPARIAFTLTELLAVIAIIGILASSILFAMWGAIEMAKEARTRTQITKLNELLMTRWEGYQTRAIRLGLPVAVRQNARVAATARLNAMRDLMRMEMPDRISDVTDLPVVVYGTAPNEVRLAAPSLWYEYRRRATQNGTRPITDWSNTYQDSECLYMIVASIRDLDSNGLDFLHEGEIGDLDGDGMPEILDAWGRPIAFIRWPAGFIAHPGLDFTWGTVDDIPAYTDLQTFTVDGAGYVVPENRDPFDPLQLDKRASVPIPAAGGTGDGVYYFNFAMYPLVCSGGPDQALDIVRYDFQPATPDVIEPFDYYRYLAANAHGGWKNDPYSILPNSGRRLGEPFVQSYGYVDNIHNHATGGE
ncbi:MAG: type II secretion system GspH family protein [Pirellulaceae bacterium]|nr:type II secretion system GspH family protein [Pirellulaceae bacterium]